METKGSIISRKTDLVGTSFIGFDDGVQRAIERAQKTLRTVRWFEVKEERGRMTDHSIEYQVTLEIGFALEETMAYRLNGERSNLWTHKFFVGSSAASQAASQ